VSFTTSFCAHVAALTGLSALVGTKIYSHYTPAGTALPYVAINRTSLTEEDDIAGADGSYYVAQYDLSIFAASTLTSEAVEAILLTMNGYNGTIGSYKVARIAWLGSENLVIPPSDGSQEAVDVISMSFEIAYA